MDQKLEFQKKRNSNFFLGGPNFFQHWSMFDSDFCPDYIFPVGHMNKPGFGKSDLDVLEFREVEINDSESKMFITRFCPWEGGPTMSLDWCEHVHYPL